MRTEINQLCQCFDCKNSIIEWRDQFLSIGCLSSSIRRNLNKPGKCENFINNTSNSFPNNMPTVIKS